MIHPPRPIKKRPPRKTKAAAKAAAVPQKKKPRTRRTALIISSVALVVAIAAGAIYYLAGVMPYQRVILTVGSANVKTGYFLKRVVANSTSDPAATLQSLTTELLVQQAAPDYGLVPVTPEDIDTALRDAAKGTNDTITDADFATWLKEQLANSGLTEKEYREIVGRNIQTQRLAEIVSANVQSIVPQVHLWAIILSTNDAAVAAKARIDAGESFSAVASDVSIDATSKANGGDLGWMPPDILSTQLSSTADSLDIGKCSDPVTYVQQNSSSSTGTTTTYVLLMVSEKSAAMQATADQVTMLKNKAMGDWLNARTQTTAVTIHGLNGSTTLDSQTSAWITYQVQKLIKKRPSTPSTATIPTTSPTTTTTQPATSPPTTTAPSTSP